MRIALVGLAASEVLIIKNYVKKHAENLDVEWASVKNKDYDALILRARFLETPEIVNLVNTTDSNVPILAIYRDDRFGTESLNRNIPSLKVPSYDKEDIIEWLSHLSGNKKLAETPSPILDEASKENDIYEKTKSTFNGADVKTAKEKALEKALAKLSATGAKLSKNQGVSASKQSKTEPKAKTFSKREFKNQEILRLIKEKKDIILTSDDKTTWVCSTKRRVYCNYSLRKIPMFSDLSFQETVISTIPDEMTCQTELSQWLWESLWASDIVFSHLVTDDFFYKLKRWPQPKAKENRTIPLRLSAYIQKDALTVSQIQKATGIDAQTVEKFVYTSQLVGFVIKTQKTSAPKVSKPEKNQHKEEAKVKLIERLRNRLGL